MRGAGFAIAAVAWASGALLAGCSDPNAESPPPPGPYQAAAQYSRDHAGQALLVLQGSQIIYRDDENGGSADLPYQLFSGTKSFNCALATAAVQDGLLSSLDETASTTLVEWQGDPKRSLITVRELLNMTSGLAESLLNLYDLLVNSAVSATSPPAVSAPGSAFSYGESAIAAFELLLSRKLQASSTFSALDALGYLDQKLFAPIGLEYAGWVRTALGQPVLSFGATVSASQWIKYGQLLRDHGSWNGTQLVPSASIDQCTTASAAFAGYGINLWLNAAMPADFKGIALAQFAGVSFTGGGPTGLLDPGGDSGLFAAVGVTDQRMYIDRTQNLVIVRMGHGGLLSDWDDAQFLKIFFGQ